MLDQFDLIPGGADVVHLLLKCRLEIVSLVRISSDHQVLAELLRMSPLFNEYSHFM